MTTNPSDGYGIYLSKSSSQPDDGDEGDDWLHFVTDDLNHMFKNNNNLIEEAGPTFVDVNISKFKNKITLSNVIAKHVNSGNYNYNDITSFLEKSCITGTGNNYALYLYVYGPNLGGNYMRFRDSSKNRQDYLQVRVDDFNFKLGAFGVFTGSIKLSQVG